MNKRVQTVLVIAFVVAFACSYLVYRKTSTHVAAPPPATTALMVAANDVKIGSVLTASDLTTMQIEGARPDGAITNPQQAIGRGVVSAIYKGEPVLESRLAAQGAGGGLASIIPSGMRACAVRVDEVVGVAGFVTPGMRVDVLISGNPPGDTDSSEGPKVKTLLQNIEVLSAGTDIQKDNQGKAESAQVVNLLVTPEQAEQLSLASSQTHIQLVLRNPLDTQVAETTGAAVSNLYSGSSGPAPKARPAGERRPAAAPQSYVVQVYNGSKQSEQKFTPGEEKQ